MNNIMEMLTSGLELSPDMILVVRCVILILVCDVFSSLVQVVVQIAKGVK